MPASQAQRQSSSQQYISSTSECKCCDSPAAKLKHFSQSLVPPPPPPSIHPSVTLFTSAFSDSHADLLWAFGGVSLEGVRVSELSA